MEQEQDPLASDEIHGGGPRGVAGEWTALLHPSAAPSPPPAVPSLTPMTELPYPGSHGAPRPPPSPTVAAEPSPILVALVAVVLVRSRLPPTPTPMAGINNPGFLSPML